MEKATFNSLLNIKYLQLVKEKFYQALFEKLSSMATLLILNSLTFFQAALGRIMFCRNKISKQQRTITLEMNMNVVFHRRMYSCKKPSVLFAVIA